MFIDTFACGPFETNTLLIGCPQTKKAAIIDAPPESAELLLAKIRERDLIVEKILLTHSHWDHIAEVSVLKKKLQCPVLVHQLDEENLKQPGSDGLPLFFPIEGVTADAYLFEGQKIGVGNLSLLVIHTPGHSPGSVCFYLEKEEVLISGDTLFQGTIGNLSFPTSKPDLMWPSLKKLALLPPDTKVFPGHGGSTTIGRESWIKDAEKHFNAH
jgi:hydroxyacylglutathione hydrolase